MFPSLEQLVPHRGPALLLCEVLAHTNQETRCRSRILADHPYLQGERVDAVIALELMAQTIAVHAALDASASGCRQQGYLLGSPAIEFFDGDFALNDDIEIVARPVHLGGAFAKYAAEVRVRGNLRAQGELNVFTRAETAGETE